MTLPDPDGAGPLLASRIVYTYDLAGRTTSETNRLGHATLFEHDNLGRLIKTIDAEEGEIYGAVTDSETGAPIRGVAVAVIGSGHQSHNAETDGEGRFRVPAEKSWKLWHRQLYRTWLSFQHPAYQTEQAYTWHGYEEVLTDRAPPTRRIDIALKKR